jgi:hypothetical protein
VFFHLKTTLLAHQKLATLSSNIPLARGKTLPSTVRGAEGNGRRKGERMRRNVRVVTVPSFRNKNDLARGERIGINPF